MSWGLGCVYLFMGSLYLNASVMSCLGSYENASCRFCMLSESDLGVCSHIVFYVLCWGVFLYRYICCKIVYMGVGYLCIVLVG